MNSAWLEGMRCFSRTLRESTMGGGPVGKLVVGNFQAGDEMPPTPQRGIDVAKAKIRQVYTVQV